MYDSVLLHVATLSNLFKRDKTDPCEGQKMHFGESVHVHVNVQVENRDHVRTCWTCAS